MAFQMFIAGETMGALNVYAEHAHAFGPETREIGMIFAAHSSVAWNTARRDEQFKSALASRDIIGQAKGMIMERYPRRRRAGLRVVAQVVTGFERAAHADSRGDRRRGAGKLDREAFVRVQRRDLQGARLARIRGAPDVPRCDRLAMRREIHCATL